MPVEIRPREFTMVRFDAGEVAAIAEQLVTDLDLDPGLDVVVEVDERIPTGAIELRSLDPITCFAESGALEHPQRLRSLHPEGTREVLGRLLLEARDQMARRRYHYRSRHGFDDRSDAGFDELWRAPHLNFAEITTISERSREVVG